MSCLISLIVIQTIGGMLGGGCSRCLLKAGFISLSAQDSSEISSWAFVKIISKYSSEWQWINEWVKVFQAVDAGFSPPGMNDWVNEWDCCTGIFSTSPLPVWHHRSWTGGARWLWHISILATASILLACRSEDKSVFTGTRCWDV